MGTFKSFAKPRFSKAKRYLPDGANYQSIDSSGRLHSELCANCGYPNGQHAFYDVCPKVVEDGMRKAQVKLQNL